MKLFLSFSGLLYALARDDVSQEDLDTALYFFGCVRSHAFNPGASSAFNEVSLLKDKGPAILARLISAVEKAEAAGRCRWHRPETGVCLAPFTVLNELLTANNFPRLSCGETYVHYCYPVVRDLVAESGNTRLEVHF